MRRSYRTGLRQRKSKIENRKSKIERSKDRKIESHKISAFNSRNNDRQSRPEIKHGKLTRKLRRRSAQYRHRPRGADGLRPLRGRVHPRGRRHHRRACPLRQLRQAAALRVASGRRVPLSLHRGLRTSRRLPGTARRGRRLRSDRGHGAGPDVHSPRPAAVCQYVQVVVTVAPV